MKSVIEVNNLRILTSKKIIKAKNIYKDRL